MAKVIGVRYPSNGISQEISGLRLHSETFEESLYKLMLDIIDSYNSSDKKTWVNDLDYILFQILIKYNFKEGERGTEYYVIILRRIIFFLQASATDEKVRSRLTDLKNQLLNPYSQFYLDIVYDYGGAGGLDTFHSYIRTASNAAREKSKSSHQSHLDQREYMKMAFVLAETVYAEIEKGNIKVEERQIDTRDFIYKLGKETKLPKPKARRKKDNKSCYPYYPYKETI